MKLPRFFVLGALVALTPLASADAQQTGSASLLPMPQLQHQYAAAGQPAPTYVAANAGGPPIQAPSPQQYEKYETVAPHSVYEEALGDDCYDGGCAKMLPRACGPQWFAGVYGLYMTRDHANPVWTSSDTANPELALLGTPQAAMDWEPGAEIRFGYIFGGDTMVEAVYWGIFKSVNTHQVNAADIPGDLDTVISFVDLDYDDGIGGTGNVNDWFNGADAHRLRRSFEFHNVELNLLHVPMLNTCNPCCRRGLALGWGVGARYLMIDETFQFAADDNNTTYGDSDDEIYYDIELQNHLIGAQTAFRADYWFAKHLSLFSEMKFGIYANAMHHRQRVYGPRGNATVNNGPYNGDDYDISSSKTDVAFLGEWRLGSTWQFTDHWRAVAAYRAVAMTGVALPGNQIPMFFGDLDGVADVDSNGSMILHGLQLGVECTY